jgi:hypothetical protein
MWTFHQSTGIFRDKTGQCVCIGYAGREEGKNNPAMQDHKQLGPIPRGKYKMNPPVDTAEHGPYVIWLTPDPANEMFGRSGFGIHGFNAHDPNSSQGCPEISPLTYRAQMWESGDHELEVVA